MQRSPLSPGVVRAVFRLCLVLIMAFAAYIGLVRYGVLPNPFAPAVGGDIELARSDRSGLRVLFVGNSFTFKNDMPEMVHDLALGDPGDPPIFAVQYTAPSWSLRKASEDAGLAALLKEVRWNVVVLQERSWLPASSLEQRRKEVVPFAQALDRKITRAGARTLLFMTWGYKHGDRASSRRDDTFAAMQGRLEAGYTSLGAELSAPVAPVGLAWAEALKQRPDLGLWAGDGRHPSRLGSYLAACVFYALLSGRDPNESAFSAGLAPQDARFLRRVAADVTTIR
jgi:hypothetical protein